MAAQPWVVAVGTIVVLIVFMLLQQKWGNNADQGAHSVPIVLAMACSSQGPILELGVNPFTTPLIHELGRQKGRNITTYDTKDKTRRYRKNLSTNWHTFRHTSKENPESDGRWGVAVVQGFRKDTARCIRDLKPNTGVIVVKDADETLVNRIMNPGLEDACSKFRYRYRVRGVRPSTWLLSDTIDVSKVGKYYFSK